MSEKMSNAAIERWKDPAYREKMSNAAIERWQDPAQREKGGERSIKRWQDPAYRERVSKAMKEAQREKGGERSKRVREIVDEYIKGLEEEPPGGEGDDEQRDERTLEGSGLPRETEQSEGNNSDDDGKQSDEEPPGGEGEQGNAMREHWKDPAYRERVSNTMKERWKDPAFREDMIARMRVAARRGKE